MRCQGPIYSQPKWVKHKSIWWDNIIWDFKAPFTPSRNQLNIKASGEIKQYAMSNPLYDQPKQVKTLQLLLRQFTQYNILRPIYHFDNWCYLKLPSLFAAWLFWTFHTKTHNMKALVKTLQILLRQFTQYKILRPIYHFDNWCYLKLPSLYGAWLFWTFHTKSHNMKALVILNHSWSLFLPLHCLYGKDELLWVSVQPSGVFSWENKSPQITHAWKSYDHDHQ